MIFGHTDAHTHRCTQDRMDCLKQILNKISHRDNNRLHNENLFQSRKTAGRRPSRAREARRPKGGWGYHPRKILKSRCKMVHSPAF